MTKYILVRHGQPTYEEVINLGFKGHGIALAPLTERGIEEVKKTIKNKIFEDSDILISSPYPRAMQTASIIGKKYNRIKGKQKKNVLGYNLRYAAC